MALTIKPVHTLNINFLFPYYEIRKHCCLMFFLFLLCVYVYVCVLHVCICMCVNEHVYRCACMQKPEVVVKNYLSVLLHLIHWDKISQLNPELTDTVSLASQLALVISLWVGHHSHLTFIQASEDPALAFTLAGKVFQLLSHLFNF